MKKETLIPPIKQAPRASRRKLAGMRSRAQFSALEARTLYSADLGVTAALPGADGPQVASAEFTGTLGPAAYGRDAAVTDKAVAEAAARPADRDTQANDLAADDLFKLVNEVRNPASPAALEIVLIDSRVQDIDSLRQAFQAEIDAGRNLAVMVIDTQTDGISRVTQMLSMAGQKVSAIHIISHGEVGEFTLGTTEVNSQTLEARSAEFAGWSRYLSADADVLIYGCDVAANLSGEQFLVRFGELTGTDVAASSDLTGAKTLGGDWDLEYQSGQINRSGIASTDLQNAWQQILPNASATFPVNQTLPGDQVTGAISSGTDPDTGTTFMVLNGNKSIAVNESGDTAITWSDLSNNRVMVRAFEHDGAAIGNEIVVFDPAAEGITDTLLFNLSSSSVAMRADGSFVVTWVVVTETASDTVYAQRFTSEGLKLGSRITVSGTGHPFMRSPEIDVDDSGGFVIAWAESNQTSLAPGAEPTWSVYAQAYEADGSVRFAPKLIDGSVPSLLYNVDSRNPSLAVAGDGSFVVAFEQFRDFILLPDTDSVLVARYHADGTDNGSKTKVNADVAGFVPFAPSVDASRDGSFVVAYNFGSSATSNYSIYAKPYDPSGQATAALFQVSENDGSRNANPSVAIDPNDGNRYVVAWARLYTTPAVGNVVARGYGGLEYQSGVYNLTSSTTLHNLAPAIASNGNLIATSYNAAQSPTAPVAFDVAVKSYINDTNAYATTAPTIQAPSVQTMVEDGQLQLSLPAGNAIQIGDSDDAGLLSVTLTLPAGSGTLSIANTSMITTLGGVPMTGPATGATLSFNGTLTDINHALAQLVVTPAANYNGTLGLTVSVTELYGSNITVSDLLAISVSAVNDAPTLTLVSPSATVMPGKQLSLAAQSINVQDVDAASGTMTVEVIATHGNVTLSTPGSVTVTLIDRMNGSNRERGLAMTGPLADINAALAQLKYTSDTSYVGPDVISLVASDGGNTGTGGVLSANQSIYINVVADQAPVLNGPVNLSASIDEDSSNPLATLFGVPALSISDADADTSRLRLGIDVSQGYLTSTTTTTGILVYGTNVPLTFPVSAAHIDVTGTLNELNAFIASLWYSPAANFNGSDTMTIQVDDQLGYAQSHVTSTRSITVNSINDAPEVSMGSLASMPAEDVRTTLGSMFSGITVSDADIGTGLIEVTVVTGSGNLHLDTPGMNLYSSADNSLLTADLNGSTLTFRGTLADVNAALPQIFYTGALNSNGNGFYVTVSVNDLGNNSGPAATGQIAAQTATFAISAVDDAPVLSTGASSGNVIEDTPVLLNSLFSGALSVSDVDAGSASIKLDVSVERGTMSVDVSGLNLVDAASGLNLNGTLTAGQFHLLGTQANLSTALQRIYYQPVSNEVSPVVLSLHVDDLGNSGTIVSGASSLTASESLTLAVTAINDSPVISMGTVSGVIVEDVAVSIGSLLPYLSISDVDAGSGNLLLTLTAGQGTLALDTTGLGLIDRVTGNLLNGVVTGTTVAFKAPLSTLNAVLPLVMFTPDANANGPGFSFAVSVDDLGNTGLTSGANVIPLDVRYFNVQAVNDAPVFQSGTPSGTVTESTTTPLSALFSNVLDISDVDAGTGQMKLTVSTTLGGFSLDSTGLNLTNANTGAPLGSPVGNLSLSILGSLTDLNTALQRIQFSPAPDSDAPAVITLNIDDMGNTGTLVSGASGTDELVAPVTIAAVNNKPGVSFGSSFTVVMEDTPATLGALYPDLAITDIDAGTGNMLVTLNATMASLSIDTTGLGLFDAQTGAALQGVLQGVSISFKAPLATLNAVLPQVLFTPDLNANGSGFAVQLTVDDLGNTGTITLAGTTDSATSYLTVNAVNDAPVVHIGTQASDIPEDTAVNLASLFTGSQLAISDIDAGTAPVDLTVTVSQGNMTLDMSGLSLADPATGLALTSNPSGATLTLRGTVAQLNAALQAIQYQTAQDLTTPVTLSLHVDDLGNSGGSNTPAQVTEYRTLNVAAVNDAPVAIIGVANAPIPEDTPTTLGSIFSSISVSDVDAGSGNLLITLSSNTKGQLSLNTAGLGLLDAVTGAPISGTLNGATISFRGSLSAINTALPQVLFAPNLNSNGTGFAVTLTVDDLGNSGSVAAGSTVASVTQSFSVSAVNDQARVGFGTTISPVAEDTPTTLASIFQSVSIIDPDSGTGLLKVTLSVNKGSLAFDTSGRNLFDANTGAALSGALSGTTLSFQGTKASLNAALPGIVFSPEANANGTGYTLTATVDDQGNTGSSTGAPAPVTVIRNFSVNAINDAPAVNAQNVVGGLEDTPLVFSLANGNLISISDPDGNVSVTIDLSVSNGLLTLGNVSGLSFASGDGTSDAAMRFTGTLAQLNSALNGLVFTPDKDFAGDASLAITLNDNGNTGSGGALSAQSAIALRMAQVNDAPAVVNANSVTQDAGVATTISTALLQVSDIESAPTQIVYTLTAAPAQGAMLLNGVALQPGSTFTQADLNAGQIIYLSSPAAGGTDVLKLSVQDGSGSSPMPVEVSITVKAAPAFQTSTNGTTSSGSSGTGSTTTGTTSTAITASKAAATDAGAAATSSAAGGSAAGASFSAGPGTDTSAAQKPAGSNAGVSAGLANIAPAGNNGAALGGQTRSDAGRLPDAPLASLAPIANSAPVTPAVATQEVAKPTETERPIFVTPGITLPTQGISLDKMVGDNSFQKEMGKVREDVMHVAALDRGVVASTIGVSASFTLGYILWLVRGGVLISSLLASLPAWRMVDPLPVLGSLGNSGKNKDDKSLEELVEQNNDADDDVEQLEEETA